YGALCEPEHADDRRNAPQHRLHPSRMRRQRRPVKRRQSGRCPAACPRRCRARLCEDNHPLARRFCMRAAPRTAVVLVLSGVFGGVLPGAARAQDDARRGDAVGFDIAWNHVALSVPIIAESIAWYEKMLGFKGTVRGGPPNPNARQQVADLRRGNVTIELFQVTDAAPLPE